MSSPFDKVPYKVLEHIIGYLSESKRDLRQLQMTSKRLQSITEEHIYRELLLLHRWDPEYIFHFVMEMTPQRCKLVKSLRMWKISDLYIIDRVDFFGLCCNIESMNVESGLVDWQLFNKTFTPERCKLKELPDDHNTSPYHNRVEDYVHALQNHSKTLLKVKLTSNSERENLQLLKTIGDSCNFPQLRSFHITLPNSPSLLDVDTLINNYPLLEKLELSLFVQDITAKWIPTIQHQGLMNSISLCFSSLHQYSALFTYVTAKFPNVQEYRVSDIVSSWPNGGSLVLNNGERVAPFRKYADSFHLLMRSMKVELNILTTYLSYPAVLAFLKAYHFSTSKISVKHQALNLSIDTALIQEEKDMEVVKISIKYSQLQNPVNNSAEVVIDRVKFFDSADDTEVNFDLDDLKFDDDFDDDFEI